MKTTSNLMIANVSRRSFLQGVVASSALVLAARWDFATASEEEAKYGAEGMPNGWVDNPNVFISIEKDGTVTITNHRAEMGQGIRTSLVMVAADELGADWEKVKVSQAPGDEKRFGNQNTDGSRSMRHWYNPMRRAAAAARTMLEQTAAKQWDVEVSDCVAGVHQVEHKPTGRALGFGELAMAARDMEVPDRDSLVLKTSDQHRYIGKDTGPSQGVKTADIRRPKAIDGEDIVTGKAVYGADVILDNMLFAVIARPPVYGAAVASVDDSEALKVPGVEKVISLQTASQPAAFAPLGGVAVVATNTWAALEGRRALKIEWDLEPAGDNASYESESYRKTMEEAARSAGKVIRTSGNIDQAFEDADQQIDATYYMPHMAQSPMEPPVALARVADGKVEAWAPVQHPQLARDALAGMLELDPENVTVNVTLLGGGFGRKSKPDFVLEAVALAAQLDGRPVRVQWSREDDLHHSFFHAVSVDRLEAALDKDGKAIGWRHRTVSPSIMSLFAPAVNKSDLELGMGFNTLPFDIPAIRLENPEAPAHVRIGWFRAVYNLPHAYAIQSFAAEMAAAAGRDHRDYLLELLGPDRKINPRDVNDTWNYGEDPELYQINTARLRGVVEKATEAAGWGKDMPKGRGLGLAVHHSFQAYAAVVIEVEVDEAGKVTVHSADIAFDCGQQVNPERIRSQMEGSCIMGVGIALHTEITADEGRIQEDNFHQYQIPRMEHGPHKIRVHLVNNDPDLPMGGVGEPGLPPVAPAVTNAIFAATGKRIRRLPVGNQLAS